MVKKGNASRNLNGGNSRGSNNNRRNQGNRPNGQQNGQGQNGRNQKNTPHREIQGNENRNGPGNCRGQVNAPRQGNPENGRDHYGYGREPMNGANRSVIRDENRPLHRNPLPPPSPLYDNEYDDIVEGINPIVYPYRVRGEPTGSLNHEMSHVSRPSQPHILPIQSVSRLEDSNTQPVRFSPRTLVQSPMTLSTSVRTLFDKDVESSSERLNVKSSFPDWNISGDSTRYARSYHFPKDPRDRVSHLEYESQLQVPRFRRRSPLPLDFDEDSPASSGTFDRQNNMSIVAFSRMEESKLPVRDEYHASRRNSIQPRNRNGGVNHLESEAQLQAICYRARSPPPLQFNEDQPSSSENITRHANFSREDSTRYSHPHHIAIEKKDGAKHLKNDSQLPTPRFRPRSPPALQFNEDQGTSSGIVDRHTHSSGNPVPKIQSDFSRLSLEKAESQGNRRRHPFVVTFKGSVAPEFFEKHTSSLCSVTISVTGCKTGRFAAFPTDTITEFNEMNERIQEAMEYLKAIPPKISGELWQPGVGCIVRCSQNGWSRGMVVERKPDQEFLVYKMDLAVFRKVPLSDIWPLLPEFNNIAAFAANCCSMESDTEKFIDGKELIEKWGQSKVFLKFSDKKMRNNIIPRYRVEVFIETESGQIESLQRLSGQRKVE
ncbi:hypothetical protein GCK72_025859 [Caenorhabditis remanei]|uniref:Tudor domain-containing protein n=1 Tax=Caenorhabditis remanei TaxID=31234 RepID=A0A6A5G3U8_CAERE|nr:hypothetical protein GCK72_025859 [Caenorhabditis remanei]KAF1749391.1 hypothetical protein GCK72_025859 [Caenorhabditis remanei]